MTAQTATATSFAAGPAAAGTRTASAHGAGLLGYVSARLAEAARFRRTRRELLALSERELEDIGVSAYDINRVAYDTSRRA